MSRDERAEAQLAEASRRIADLERELGACARQVVRLVAERDRLLWLACQASYYHNGADPDNLDRILREHGHDQDRIERVAKLPEPVVPR